MYYAEKMIEGILHYRYDPKGRWIACPADMLNRRLAEQDRQIAAFHEGVEKRVEAAYQKGRDDFRDEVMSKVADQLKASLGVTVIIRVVE